MSCPPGRFFRSLPSGSHFPSLPNCLYGVANPISISNTPPSPPIPGNSPQDVRVAHLRASIPRMTSSELPRSASSPSLGYRIENRMVSYSYLPNPRNPLLPFPSQKQTQNPNITANTHIQLYYSLYVHPIYTAVEYQPSKGVFGPPFPKAFTICLSFFL